MPDSETPAIQLPSSEAIEAAASAIRPYAIRTPLVRLQHPGKRPIYLKLENLQPIGSFKIRCAASALLARFADGLRHVRTASAGNFAQGLAYVGRMLGMKVTAVVPDTAARTKLDALARMGASIDVRPYANWWAMMEDVEAVHDDASFIHPVADTLVLAGNATIGREILEDLPRFRTVRWGRTFGGRRRRNTSPHATRAGVCM